MVSGQLEGVPPPECGRCYRAVDTPAEAAEAYECPVAIRLTEGERSNDVAGTAAWIALRDLADHPLSTPGLIEPAFREGPLASPRKTTRNSRVNTGLRAIQDRLGTGTLAVDRDRRPVRCEFDEHELQVVCGRLRLVGDHAPGVQTEDDGHEPPEAAEEEPIPTLAELTNMAYNLIIAGSTDRETDKAALDAFEDTVKRVVSADKAKVPLVQAALSEATGKCLRTPFIRDYKKAPNAHLIHSGVCRIRDRLV